MFKHEQDLIDEIMSYIQTHQANRVAFTWTAKAAEILNRPRCGIGVMDKMETAQVNTLVNGNGLFRSTGRSAHALRSNGKDEPDDICTD